jgi:hypothetical protein
VRVGGGLDEAVGRDGGLNRISPSQVSAGICGARTARVACTCISTDGVRPRIAYRITRFG